jgi:hypothetical protein
MGSHAALLLLGASLATGSALAQVAALPADTNWERIDTPARSGVRWDWEGMPNPRLGLPPLETDSAATGPTADPRRWGGSKPRHGLAYGTLMRTQLSDDASLALRLRGGRLGLYLGVQLP